MAHSHTIPADEVLVSCEYDVIVLRQKVRQAARLLGFDLMKQAKMATAISTVARTLLGGDGTLFHLHTSNNRIHPALEIWCISARSQAKDIAQLEQQLHLGDARSLVDQASLDQVADGTQLTLCMWLNY